MRRTVGEYGLFAKNDLKAAVKIEFSDDKKFNKRGEVW